MASVQMKMEMDLLYKNACIVRNITRFSMAQLRNDNIIVKSVLI